MPMLTNQKSRLLGGGGLPVPVPVLGAELITNGGVETNTSGWTPISATLVQIADPRTGSAGAQALAVTNTGTDGHAVQNIANSANAWCLLNSWSRRVDSTSARYTVDGVNIITHTNTTWTQAFLVIRITNANGAVRLRAVTAVNGQSARFDDISVKPINLASMFSTRAYGTHMTTKARASIVAGTQAGVVCNLDSASAPANFVIASHDGTTARLTVCVAGTYTEKIATTVAYSAGAYVEIRRLAGTNTYQLWYAGSQVGANQTIADATVIDNTLAGYFQTYSGNQLSGFSCVPAS